MKCQVVTVAFVILALAAKPAAAGQFDHEIKQVTEDADAAVGLRKFGGGADRDTTDDSKGSLVAVPIPIVDPTLGSGIAFTGLYTFGSSDGTDSPRSTIGVAAGYTSTKSWLGGFGLKLHLNDDQYRLGAIGGYGHLNLDFYGIGSDPVLSNNPIGFSTQGGFAELFAEVRLFEGAYLGAKSRYLGAEIKSERPIDVLPDLNVDFSLVGIGPIFEYDTRDNAWWPTTGSQATAEFLIFDEAIGSDANFTSFDSRISHYWSPFEDLIIAGELRGARSSDSAPFFMFPFVSVRGFPSGQYMDLIVAQAQGELRWNAWERVGVVAFAGLGATAPEFHSFSRDAVTLGVGGGMRYRISEVDKINVGLDLAYGDDEFALYFRIGEAF